MQDDERGSRSTVELAEAVLRYAMAMRVPLILGTGLVVLPVVARGSGMFANLFVLESGWELFLVSFQLFLASSACWMVLVLVLEYAPLRLGLPAWVTKDVLGQNFVSSLVVSYVAALPAIVILVLQAELAGGGWSAWVLGGLTVVGGAGACTLVLWVANLLRSRLAALLAGTTLWSFLPRPLGEGYVDYRRGALWGDHVTAIVVLAVLGVLYGSGYVVFNPATYGGPEVPPLTYVLLLHMVLTLLLTGLSFFFDRFRVPVLSVVLLLVWLVYVSKDTDHYFAVHAAEAQSPSDLADPADAVAAWLARQPSADGQPAPLVVVCASGGGIQAAAWTAQVLSGLQEELGPRFASSIRLLSAASGGSVGVAHFVHHLRPDGAPPGPRAGQAVRDVAARSSLSASAWGIAYPDLLRATVPVHRFAGLYDRGWVLEEDWARPLEPGGARFAARLGAWARETAAGRLPGVVLNATVVETGERMLFGSVRIPDARQARSFFADFEGADVDVLTAARMSATFPYVCPVARAFPADASVDGDELPRFHLADGGYFDNFGVYSALEWLRSLLTSERWRSDLHARVGPILILEIRAFPRQQEHAADCRAGERGGWFYEVAGPLEAVLNVRSSTQIARNDAELDMLLALHPEHVRPSVVIQPLPKEPDPDENAEPGTCWCQADDYPLSWHLTAREKADVAAQWERGKEPVLARLRPLFGDG